MVVRRWALAALVAAFVCVAGIAQRTWAGGHDDHTRKQVIVPGEDRFVPFALTVHVGHAVEWVNTDTDDHTVVANDFFNTGGHKGLDFLLKGTDSNGGIPGTLKLRFDHPGTFVYYCRFHSHLDEHHQPVAPGPDGGIQDDKGNFGTPMNGIVTVLED